MTVDNFNKTIILDKLKQLSPQARSAFSAAISTRLMPVYELAAPDENEVLKRALECAWENILADQRSVPDCQTQLDIAMEMIRRIPEKAGSLKLYVEDPIAAVAYTLRSILSENAEEPTWAAQRMFETVARYIQAKNSYPVKGAELIERVTVQPLMQAEFARQFEDLSDLTQWNLETGLRIKKRAQTNPALPADLR